VTNGPFTLSQWKPNEVLVATKSPTYWDAKTVRLNAVHFYPIDSVDVEERAFRAGQLHVTDFVPVGKVTAYRRDSPQLIRLDPYLGTYFYRLNLARPPFADVRIRRALALAVDRQAIVEKVLRGDQKPAYFLTPPNTNGYTPTARIPTDFAAARELLKAAGYEGGRGLPPLELLYNTSENHRIVAEAIQEMWRRELGLNVTLVNQELKVAQASRRSGQFQILRGDWIGDYVDPATFLEVFRSDSGNNYTVWSSPAYDAALFAAARTRDPAARNALFDKAETLLLEAAPIIPIYHYTHIFLLQPSVKGWHPTLLDHHPLKYVWLE
jgi:oligopeptide transport system substrate-binding protein